MRGGLEGVYFKERDRAVRYPRGGHDGKKLRNHSRTRGFANRSALGARDLVALGWVTQLLLLQDIDVRGGVQNVE